LPADRVASSGTSVTSSIGDANGISNSKVAITAVGATSGDQASSDFARARRIVKTDEFSSVFRLRPAQKTAHFVLYTSINALPHARLGVVVAKRFAPRAATRNTIKRVTRELFRVTPLPSIDCVVRLSKAVNSKTGPATSAQLKIELRAELVRLFAGHVAVSRAKL
jgi:ribonuclease P protein component